MEAAPLPSEPEPTELCTDPTAGGVAARLGFRVGATAVLVFGGGGDLDLLVFLQGGSALCLFAAPFATAGGGPVGGPSLQGRGGAGRFGGPRVWVIGGGAPRGTIRLGSLAGGLPAGGPRVFGGPALGEAPSTADVGADVGAASHAEELEAAAVEPLLRLSCASTMLSSRVSISISNLLSRALAAPAAA